MTRSRSSARAASTAKPSTCPLTTWWRRCSKSATATRRRATSAAVPGDPAPQRARERDVPVPHRVGALADLRRHPHRQLRPWLLLHAGGLRDVLPRRRIAAGRGVLLRGALLAALAVALAGGLFEVALLRRVYRAPELYQLLLTFALVLVVTDAVSFIWGADNKTGPEAPGLGGSVTLFGQLFPTYDLAMIAFGPLVALGLWLVLLPHPLGRADSRRHAGPRDGRRPRRGPGAALHGRVRARLVPGRARGGAAGAAGAAHHGDGHRGHRRGLRGGRDRGHGLACGGRSSPRCSSGC